MQISIQRRVIGYHAHGHDQHSTPVSLTGFGVGSPCSSLTCWRKRLEEMTSSGT
ncbi:uncharacterized protein BDV14DRAFT_27744 [Aspergillus stella-maris]|uniref:uncharacterized protein n=1 Tax=Aspergillus stella-maris TaxID=1810926 RepID=UPI003CCDBC5E